MITLLSTNDRIRGRELQEIRKRFFAKHPLCSGPDSVCEKKGRTTLATDLDHIIALFNDGKDIPSNRQGLCSECHRLKTARDTGTKARRTIGADGWPVEV